MWATTPDWRAPVVTVAQMFWAHQRASLLGARRLLVAPGLTTSNKKLVGAPGITTRSKDATRNIVEVQDRGRRGESAVNI